MIERGGCPRGGGVALGTRLAEQTGFMVRVIGIAVVLFMARPAVARCSRILSADMARRAVHADVRSSEREIREVVVELRRSPRCRRMALRAVVFKSVFDMIRIVSRVVFRLVTVPTTRRGAAVLAVHVALGTIRVDVRAGQWKGRQVMIKRRRPPGTCIVTFGAGLAELVLGMIGIGSLRVFRRVARVTCNLRGRCMIILCGRPFCNGHTMAEPTIGGKSRRGMSRSGGEQIVLQMAPLAFGRHICKLPVGMTLLTVQCGVNTHQGEASLLMAHEHLGFVIPRLRCVTFFTTGLRKLAAVHIEVTVNALRACVGEDERCVARAATGSQVPADERETRCLMIKAGCGFDRNPAGSCVTGIALQRERAVGVVLGESRARS